MSDRLAVRLAEAPPGPELATLLANVDRSALSGHDAVVLLQARARQLAHVHAEFFADMVQVARCVAAEPSGTSPPEFAADEIRVALAWTRRSAETQLKLAYALAERLPSVWSALRDGHIDVPKAKVFCEETSGTDLRTARRVSERLLPEAPDLTPGRIRARLARMLIEADPAAAARRHAKALTSRKVVLGRNPDGTAFLSGCNLPPERAACARERIDALAWAAKRDGDGRTLDQIRADVYLGLLDGTHDDSRTPGRHGSVELVVDLTTLMGLNERPGELAGWGPVIADVARKVARMQRDGTWRFSVTDPDTGTVIHHGKTRRRPDDEGGGHGGAGEHAGPDGQPTLDPRRRPTGTETAFIEARDRTCRGPGCRVPAGETDKDHIIDHAKGGRTSPENLFCACRHCHRMKHEGGWTVRMEDRDRIVWTSVLGHTYVVPFEPPITGSAARGEEPHRRTA